MLMSWRQKKGGKAGDRRQLGKLERGGMWGPAQNLNIPCEHPPLKSFTTGLKHGTTGEMGPSVDHDQMSNKTGDAGATRYNKEVGGGK